MNDIRCTPIPSTKRGGALYALTATLIFICRLVINIVTKAQSTMPNRDINDRFTDNDRICISGLSCVNGAKSMKD
uniref:Uncharacterized protein n=1 Tax=Glossina palpalis gambiensis TaxID=67801 RepID=A0A1B0AVN7_9MUSC